MERGIVSVSALRQISDIGLRAVGIGCSRSSSGLFGDRSVSEINLRIQIECSFMNQGVLGREALGMNLMWLRKETYRSVEARLLADRPISAHRGSQGLIDTGLASLMMSGSHEE